MYPRIAQFKSVAAFRARLAELGLELPLDDRILSAEEGSPLAAPIVAGGLGIGNRWCIQPMEGWDARPDGSPSAHTLRRWQRFGASGAKLIWGGEAAAVEADGRANPHQTLATPGNRAGLAALLVTLQAAHRERFGSVDDLLVGLQLTHSGRFSRPHGEQLKPRIAYHHPLLDTRCGIDPRDNSVMWTDDELPGLIESYVRAAGTARDAGFRFVDIKACHGYLLHEFLSGHARPGPYGGDFAGRTRLLLTIVQRLGDEYPDLALGVRLSAFDTVPFETAIDDAGQPYGRPMPLTELGSYRWGFGVDAANPLGIDLTEALALLRALRALGVALFNISCGSPYYNPHVQRPAFFPPSDGYPPPEDPLVGVCRQIGVARQCKEALPDALVVGSGYSYLQEYLPHVAQAVVRGGWADCIGLGRMVLAYPELPADTLAGRTPDRKRLCRTFSDCTTAPRHGLASGCFPLDPYYKHLPEAAILRDIKEDRR